jgi:hypothetical protein
MVQQSIEPSLPLLLSELIATQARYSLSLLVTGSSYNLGPQQLPRVLVRSDPDKVDAVLLRSNDYEYYQYSR